MHLVVGSTPTGSLTAFFDLFRSPNWRLADAHVIDQLMRCFQHEGSVIWDDVDDILRSATELESTSVVLASPENPNIDQLTGFVSRGETSQAILLYSHPMTVLCHQIEQEDRPLETLALWKDCARSILRFAHATNAASVVNFDRFASDHEAAVQFLTERLGELASGESADEQKPSELRPLSQLIAREIIQRDQEVLDILARLDEVAQLAPPPPSDFSVEDIVDTWHRVREEVHMMELRLSHVQNEASRYFADAQKVQMRIDRMLTSRSWRYTKLLRLLSTRLRKRNGEFDR